MDGLAGGGDHVAQYSQSRPQQQEFGSPYLCPRLCTESPPLSVHDGQALQAPPNMIAHLHQDGAKQTSDDGTIPSLVASPPGNLVGDDQYGTPQLQRALDSDVVVQGNAGHFRDPHIDVVMVGQTTTGDFDYAPFDGSSTRSKSVGELARLQRAISAPGRAQNESSSPSDSKGKQKLGPARYCRSRTSLEFIGTGMRADVLATDIIQQRRDLSAEGKRRFSTLPDAAAEHSSASAVIADAGCEVRRETQRPASPMMQAPTGQKGSFNTG
ncbi:hypothetical protein E4U43_003118 [Claviceps pusilla]|uniref:Uncharacterized protein n=1 Tax=Claviceps pusilla TaxID=123648 RepID=A0A9P7SXY1_9HYPO|nr:hypothetical protein E4U43_003118 [Claviceps pusilla]